jgi:Fic family protein
MDPSAFISSRPGDLVRVPRDGVTGNEYAFVPRALPPVWDFPNALWPLLAEAKQQLGILEGIGRTLPNPGLLLRSVEDREAIKSSQLEGTYVTATELLLFEMGPQEPALGDDATNRQREVFNYRKALGQATNSELPLSLRLLRDLHKTLVTGVRGMNRSPGDFRRHQVAIGANARFVPPPPGRLSECLNSFEKYLHVGESPFDPLVRCFLVHYQFETIHPFYDGNGRVGRLLLAIMFKQYCGLSKPWLYVSDYYQKNRDEYVQRLFNVSARSDWEGWIGFCLRGSATQARDTIRRCESLLEIQEHFRRKVGATRGSARLIQIVENLFSSPFVRITDLAKQLGVTYPTAKTDIERLVQAEILQELQNVAPKTFYAPEIFNVAYREIE